MTKFKKAMALCLALCMLLSVFVAMPASAAGYSAPNEATSYANAFIDAAPGGEWLTAGTGQLSASSEGLVIGGTPEGVALAYSAPLQEKYVLEASLKSGATPTIPGDRDTRRVGMLGLRQIGANGMFEGRFADTGYIGVILQFYDYDAANYTIIFPDGTGGDGEKTPVTVPYPSGVSFDAKTPVRFAVVDNDGEIVIYVNEKESVTITFKGQKQTKSVKVSDTGTMADAPCYTEATVKVAGGSSTDVKGIAVPDIASSTFGFAHRAGHDGAQIVLSDLKLWDNAAIDGIATPDAVTLINAAEVPVTERLEVSKVKYQCGAAGLGYLALVETDYETGAFVKAVTNDSNDVKSIILDGVSLRSVVKAYRFDKKTEITASNYTSSAVTGALVNENILAPEDDMANFVVAGAFGDHMVLQRDVGAQIWGWSKRADGTVITATIGDYSASGKVKDGEWMLHMPSMPANAVPQTMTITDGEYTVEFDDVLIGDVYFVDGQSNMDDVTFAMSETYGEDISRADNSNIRLFYTSHQDIRAAINSGDLNQEYTSAPRRNPVNNPGTASRMWEVSSRTTAGKFSGVSYYAALYLAESHPEVPVGMIQVAFTGSTLAQLSPAVVNEQFYPSGVIAKGVQDAKRYNGLMAAFEKYTVRGILWYQGYSDAWAGNSYTDSYPARHKAYMEYIADVCGNPDMMTYMVHLTSFGYDNTSDYTHARFRSMQMTMLDEEQLLMASAMDDGFSYYHGDTDRLHPPHNKIPGTRMGKLIREDVFGDLTKDQARSPWPASYTGELSEAETFKFDATGVTITYANAGEGLALAEDTGTRLLGFELIKDGVAYKASAKIVGKNQVRVDGVANPDGVRYAFYVEASKYAANLVNADGFGATAFTYPYSAVEAPLLWIGCQLGAQPQLRFDGATLAYSNDLTELSTADMNAKWYTTAQSTPNGASLSGNTMQMKDQYGSYIAQFMLDAENASASQGFALRQSEKSDLKSHGILVEFTKDGTDTATVTLAGTQTSVDVKLPSGFAYTKTRSLTFEVVDTGDKIEVYLEDILLFTVTITGAGSGRITADGVNTSFSGANIPAAEQSSIGFFAGAADKMNVKDFTLWHKSEANIKPDSDPAYEYELTNDADLADLATSQATQIDRNMGLRIANGQTAVLSKSYPYSVLTVDVASMGGEANVLLRQNADAIGYAGICVKLSDDSAVISVYDGAGHAAYTTTKIAYPSGSDYGTVQLGVKDLGDAVEIYIDGTLIGTVALEGLASGSYTAATVDIGGTRLSFEGASVPATGKFAFTSASDAGFYIRNLGLWKLPAPAAFDVSGAELEYENRLTGSVGDLAVNFSGATAVKADDKGVILGTKEDANGTMNMMYETARATNDGYAVSVDLMSGAYPSNMSGDPRRVTTLALRQAPGTGIVSGNFPEVGYLGVAIQIYNYNEDMFSIVFKNSGASGKAVDIPLPDGITFSDRSPIMVSVIDTEREIKVFINEVLAAVVTLSGEKVTGPVEYSDGGRTKELTYYKNVSVTDYTGATTNFEYAIVPEIAGSTFGLGMRCGHNYCHVYASNLKVWQLPESASNVSSAFIDLADAAWATEAINALVSRNILSGYGDGIFRPMGIITRDEYTKVIASLFGLTYTGGLADYTDVPSSAWQYPYIMAASQAGVVQGVSDVAFGSGREITRQDMAVIIYRAVTKLGYQLPTGEAVVFTDAAAIADYAKDAVAALFAAKIINGMGDGTFAPSAQATRAQAAQIVYNLINALGM